MLSSQYSSVLGKEIGIGDYVDLDITGTGTGREYLVSGIADVKSQEKNFLSG